MLTCRNFTSDEEAGLKFSREDVHVLQVTVTWVDLLSSELYIIVIVIVTIILRTSQTALLVDCLE